MLLGRLVLGNCQNLVVLEVIEREFERRREIEEYKRSNLIMLSHKIMIFLFLFWY